MTTMATTREPCPACGGEGGFEDYQGVDSRTGEPQVRRYACQRCDGTGSIDAAEAPRPTALDAEGEPEFTIDAGGISAVALGIAGGHHQLKSVPAEPLLRDTRGGALILEPRAEGRQCGDCTLCCKTQSISQLPEFKPAGKWCPHCTPGKGCGIYDARPEECRTFLCSWLSGRLPEELRPTRVKAVIGSNTHGDCIVIHVDPGSPGAPDQDPLRTWIARVSQSVPVIITTGTKRRLVYSGSRNVNVRDPATGKVWLGSDKPAAIVEPGI